MEIKQNGKGRKLEWEVREPDEHGYKHDGHRYYKTTATVYYADCKDKSCGFHLEARNAKAVGAIHHDKYGHPVEIFCVRTINYG